MPRGAISTGAARRWRALSAESTKPAGANALHPSIRVRQYASVDTRIHLLKIQLDKKHCAQYNLIKDNSTSTTHFRKGEQAYENSL